MEMKYSESEKKGREIGMGWKNGGGKGGYFAGEVQVKPMRTYIQRHKKTEMETETQGEAET